MHLSLSSELVNPDFIERKCLKRFCTLVHLCNRREKGPKPPLDVFPSPGLGIRSNRSTSYVVKVQVCSFVSDSLYFSKRVPVRRLFTTPAIHLLYQRLFVVSSSTYLREDSRRSGETTRNLVISVFSIIPQPYSRLILAHRNVVGLGSHGLRWGCS